MYGLCSGQRVLTNFPRTGEEVDSICKHFSAVWAWVNKSLECISPSRLSPFRDHLPHFLCSQSLLLICPQVHSWLSCLTVSDTDWNILSVQSNRVQPYSYLHWQVIVQLKFILLTWWQCILQNYDPNIYIRAYLYVNMAYWNISKEFTETLMFFQSKSNWYRYNIAKTLFILVTQTQCLMCVSSFNLYSLI